MQIDDLPLSLSNYQVFSFNKANFELIYAYVKERKQEHNKPVAEFTEDNGESTHEISSIKWAKRVVLPVIVLLIISVLITANCVITWQQKRKDYHEVIKTGSTAVVESGKKDTTSVDYDRNNRSTPTKRVAAKKVVATQNEPETWNLNDPVDSI